MVTTSPKSDSFPSTPTTIGPPAQGACESDSPTAGGIRLEWNGLAGCRVLRIIRHADDTDADTKSRRKCGDEELIGEICEPFS